MSLSKIPLFLAILIVFGWCNSENLAASLKDELNNANIRNETISYKTKRIKLRCLLIKNQIINAKFSHQEPEYKLSISGNLIRFSDIPSKDYCNGTIVMIQMFSTEKIIIDRNFTSEGRNLVLALAAPVWKIRGKIEINLNGYDGGEHEKSAAEDGDLDGDNNGRNGTEGFPGGPGGHFHGIAGIIVNKHNLYVSVDGGRGGAGQDGGNGAEGKNGTEFDLVSKKINIDGSIEGFFISSIYKQILSTNPKDSYKEEIIEVAVGKRATRGGHGGNGGPGGAGGARGIYTVFNLNNSTCNYENRKTLIQRRLGILGSVGTSGNGGEGATGGYSGSDVYLDLIICHNGTIYIKKYQATRHFKCENGKNGIDGSLIDRKAQPVRNNVPESFENTVHFYKEFLTFSFNIIEDVSTNLTLQKLQLELWKNCSYDLNILPMFFGL